jgi:hypothetical protein
LRKTSILKGYNPMLKRHIPILILAPGISITALIASRTAKAQSADFACLQTYGGSCFYGKSPEYQITSSFYSNSAIAVLADEQSTGVGVQASSGSGGIAVEGLAFATLGTLSQEFNPPSGSIGGYFAANSAYGGGYGAFGETLGGYAVYGEDTSSGYGGYFTSLGTGTAGTNAALYGNATGTGSTGTGVLGTGYGYGVYGYSADAIGVYGNSTNGWGVVGTLTGHAPGTTAGVYGDGNTNDGVYGTSSSGNGVVGNSSSATGVYGKATSAYGVVGQVTTGTGVFGYSTSSGNGVYGRTNSTALNVAAVTGYNDNGTSAGLAGLFQGNVTITGSLTVENIDMLGSCTGNACTSDIRLKQNVRPLTDALDTLLQFKGVTFEWKNPEEHQNHTGKQTGVIAQDVEKVIPQWVGEDKKGFKTVDPDARTVLALQVEAFREQQAEINDLKAEVRYLKAHLFLAAEEVCSSSPHSGLKTSRNRGCGWHRRGKAEATAPVRRTYAVRKPWGDRGLESTGCRLRLEPPHRVESESGPRSFEAAESSGALRKLRSTTSTRSR